MKTEKPYNRIILVGNGFDRAMGLKTSYKNFIDDFIKNAVLETLKNKTLKNKTLKNKTFNSNLISLSIENRNITKEGIDKFIQIVNLKESANEVLELEPVQRLITIDYKFIIFKQIIKDLDDLRWVDLEQYYFDKLKMHYKNYTNRNIRHEGDLEKIRNLNKFMDAISVQLHNYILKVQGEFVISHLHSPFASLIDKCQNSLRQLRKNRQSM